MKRSFGCGMKLSPPRTMHRRSASKSPKRRPQLAHLDGCVLCGHTASQVCVESTVEPLRAACKCGNGRGGTACEAGKWCWAGGCYADASDIDSCAGVVCEVEGQCKEAVCDAGTGKCGKPFDSADGTPCDDGSEVRAEAEEVPKPRKATDRSAPPSSPSRS